MGNCTLVELNHDYSPGWNDEALLSYAKKMRMYLGSGDKADLPKGVTFKHRGHHSEPYPIAGRGDPS